MPRPTAATTLQRPDLGAIAYEYNAEASQRGFIGQVILPVFDVPEQSADYPKIPIEALIKIQDTKRAPRANYARSDYEFKTGTYACEEHGWEELVDDVEAALYRRYFDAEEVAIKRAVDIINRGKENRIGAMIFNSGNFTVADVAIAWNTPATAVPRTNVIAGRQAMRAASGLEPNVGVCSKKVFETFLLTAEIKDALKYTNPIEIGGFEAQKRVAAMYLGLDEILVGNAIKDTAKKGQAASLGDIWDDEYFGLFKVSSGGNDLREPVVGRTFLWTADSPGLLVTEQYREEKKRSNVYRVRENLDEAFIFQGAGYLLGNIIHP
jgi:hypothetical protein